MRRTIVVFVTPRVRITAWPFRQLAKLMYHSTRAAAGRAGIPAIAIGGTGALGGVPALSLTD
jgi:hypothetical protein